jgi:hypothetical protein
MASLEPELENLLVTIVPGLAETWQGATTDQIDAIEKLAGRPLPRFYRWFLGRMGRNMGPLEDMTRDCSAERVLRCYADGLVTVDRRYLLVGYETDESVPMHLFYDLDRPVREDAPVVEMYLSGADPTDRFETFREKLAWSAFAAHRLQRLPKRCVGLLTASGSGGVLAQLAPVMSALGFDQPIETGAFCGIFDRNDAAMVCTISPEEPPLDFIVFRLGGASEGALRQLLGTIVTEPELSIEVQSWDPPLE